MRDNLYLKIFAALFLTFSLVSCENDDEPFPTPSVDPQPEVSATLSFNDVFYSLGDTGSYTADVGSAATTRQVFVESVNYAGSVAGFNTSVTSALLNAGESSVTSQITLPSINGRELAFDETDETTGYTFEITGVRQGELVEQEDGSTDFVASGGDANATRSVPVAVPIYDRTPTVSSTGMRMLLDWRAPETYDLDLYVFDTNFELFESSESGSRYETDIMNTSHPDGDYFFVVGYFNPGGPGLPEDVAMRFFLRHPDGTKTLFEAPLVQGTEPGLYIVGSFSKAGDQFTNLAFDGNGE